MSNRLNPITEEWTSKHDWTLKVDGEKVPFSHLKVSTEKFGVGFEVGLRPEGFPGPAFYETGGTITILYAWSPEGELLIGLLEKKRLNLSQYPILEAMGGMVDPGESYEESRQRESQEEGGIPLRAAELPGMASWNRLYNFADLDEEEGGVKRYALEVPFSFLHQEGEGYRFNDYVVEEKSFKKDIFFLPWKQAARTPDAIASSGILLLIALLEEEGEM